MIKQCFICKKYKDSNEFHNKKKAKDGKHPYCKECRKIRTKDYGKKNKEILKEKNILYYEKNKEKCKKYQKQRAEKLKNTLKDIPEYKKCNSCGKIKHNTEYYKNSTDITGLNHKCKECSSKIDHKRKKQRAKFYRSKEQRKKRQQREKIKRDTDPAYKLEMYYRNYLGRALRKNMNSKKAKAFTYLGCTIQKLKEFLENQFKTGMSWDNYGYYGWHIDHILPVSSFNFNNENEIKKCFHYTNLQPLWRKENFDKRDKII